MDYQESNTPLCFALTPGPTLQLQHPSIFPKESSDHSASFVLYASEQLQHLLFRRFRMLLCLLTTYHCLKNRKRWHRILVLRNISQSAELPVCWTQVHGRKECSCPIYFVWGAKRRYYERVGLRVWS